MNRFDDIPEMDDIEVKRKPKKSPEEDMEEKIYKARCKLVEYSKVDYSKFIEYLRENENLFRKMDDCSKECMRRTCENAMVKGYGNYDDVDYFNKVFGSYIDPKKSKRIPTSVQEIKEKKMSLEEEIAYRSRGTYYAMWDFISNPEWQEKLKGRADLYDKVKYMIDRAKENNESVSPMFKTYEPSDEEMYDKVLNLMKEVKE